MPEPGFTTVRADGCTRTSGLHRIGQRELELHYAHETSAPIARDLADAIVAYIDTTGARIVGGEKMAWATSVLRFDECASALCVTALDLESDTFVHELDVILREWDEQRIACKDAGSAYIKTDLTDMIVTSPDVLKNQPVLEGIRYPFKPPSSGWWLIGVEYRGDLSSMRRIHVGDLLLARSELRRYLALGPGFCFSQRRYPAVWFEAKVSKEAPI
jgi:hypothetical protein